MSYFSPAEHPDVEVGVYEKPSPALAEMGVGFDAILQFRDDVVRRFVLQDLGALGAPATIPISFSDVTLSGADYAYLRNTAPKTYSLPSPGGDAPTPSSIQYVAIGFGLSLQEPAIELTPGVPGSAKVIWNASLLAIYQQTAASMKTHPGTPATLPGHVADGTIGFDGALAADSISDLARVWGAAVAGKLAVSFPLPSGVFLDVPNAIATAFAAGLSATSTTGRLRLTPLIMFGGAGATLKGLGVASLQPAIAVVNGNEPGTTVLCLAINFDRPDSPGIVGEVSSFVRSSSFAFYVTIETMRRMLSASFESGPATTIEGVAPIPFLDTRTRATVMGSGRVQSSINTLPSLDFQPYFWPDGATLARDPVRISGTLNVILLEIDGPDGKSIPLTDMPPDYKDADQPFSWTVFPFQAPPTEDDTTPGGRQLIARILTPTLLPIQGGLIDQVNARSSAAVNALVYWGNFVR